MQRAAKEVAVDAADTEARERAVGGGGGDDDDDGGGGDVPLAPQPEATRLTGRRYSALGQGRARCEGFWRRVKPNGRARSKPPSPLMLERLFFVSVRHAWAGLSLSLCVWRLRVIFGLK